MYQQGGLSKTETETETEREGETKRAMGHRQEQMKGMTRLVCTLSAPTMHTIGCTIWLYEQVARSPLNLYPMNFKGACS